MEGGLRAVDPNDVMMTGENSFVRLSHDGGKTLADRWSHWRVLWCPAGPGHVLLAQAELTGANLASTATTSR